MKAFERLVAHTHSRRNVVRGLSALGAASLMNPVVAAAQAGPMFRVKTLNHIHIDVSDMAKSADFYAIMFGGRVHEKSKNFWTMTFPTTDPNFAYWVSLSKAPQPKVSMDGSGLHPGHYSHMGVGVEIASPEATTQAVAAMNRRWPFAQARGAGPWTSKNEFPDTRSIYHRDPDGLIIQIVRPTDDGYLFETSRDPNPPAWTPPAEKPLTTFRTLNHMHFDVSDLEKSTAFYKDLLGATIRDKSANGNSYTLLLPTNTPGRPMWFSMTKVTTGKASLDGSGVKPGQYSHVGFGVEMAPTIAGTKSVADAINKRFPFAKAAPTGPGKPDGSDPGGRSIYMRDPDGLILQLNRPDDDGWLPKSTG